MVVEPAECWGAEEVEGIEAAADPCACVRVCALLPLKRHQQSCHSIAGSDMIFVKSPSDYFFPEFFKFFSGILQKFQNLNK